MKTKAITWYRIQVPVATFAIPWSREFQETYPFPPPATIYGMMLSLVGEVDRYKYQGVGVSVCVVEFPEMSWVLRKIRRFKQPMISHKENSKPDQVCLLTSLEFVAGIADSDLPDVPSLNDKIQEVLLNPKNTCRFGGLSCGESHNLINSIQTMDSSEFDANKEVW
jgi:CRISPR-associated protein Cas5t